MAHASRDLDHFSLLPTMKAKTWPLDIDGLRIRQLGVHRVFGFRAFPSVLAHSIWSAGARWHASAGLAVAADGGRR